MIKLTSMKKLRWEARKKKLREEAIEKTIKISEWVKENREMLAVAVPTGGESYGDIFQSMKLLR